MRVCATHRAAVGLLAALLLAPAGDAAAGPAEGLEPRVVVANLPAAMAEYRRKLDAYNRAREKYEQVAGAYWDSIAEKRRTRFAKRRAGEAIRLDDYVLTQPPVYTGPPRPVDPSGEDKPPRIRKPIPVVADFLKSAREHFDFVPQRPKSEAEFKRAYAEVAAAAGLTREQAVRVYGFEVGGNGLYDTQAGLEYSRDARAISTALGYNQLLTTNTVNLLHEQGDNFARTLRARAQHLSGPARAALERKTAILQRMVAFCRTVPNKWSEQVKLADTPQGLGVHALNLDIDVGPLLQTHKLLTSVVFARQKGHRAPLSAAELEMMNLTGDGNGFDIVSMPPALREQVPTANFFQRGGYERNPVAIRNNTVARLLAVTDSRMDKASTLPGARELAAAFAAVR
jgi:hypothetical protein